MILFTLSTTFGRAVVSVALSVAVDFRFYAVSVRAATAAWGQWPFAWSTNL
jgi:hypothetical protein